MRYWYFDDFRPGISVFAIFSYGIAVLGSPQCPPLYSLQNLDLPCDLYPRFDLQNLTEDECLAEFRFRKTDIPRLSQALRIPDVIICHQGTICEGTEGLCMLLKRLCYPCQYSDMVHLFAKPVPVLCMITNQVLDYIYQAHSHRILQ